VQIAEHGAEVSILARAEQPTRAATVCRKEYDMNIVTYRALETQMTDLTDKEELLEGSGYRYHFDRMLYVNRTARRAFSLEFVEDNSRQEIQRLIDQLPATNDWVFHFNELPSDRLRRDLAEDLGK